MRIKILLAVGAAGALISFGVAQAAHVTGVDPTTVPLGFLAAHNSIDEVPVNALARAVKPDGADVFIQHIRLGANATTGWHTHPGPVIVTVVAGSFTFEDAVHQDCRRVTYLAGEGFVDEGFGHVHRLDSRVVGDLHGGVLELIVVERVFLFPLHDAPPFSCFTGGVYFFGVGSVRLKT